MVVGRVSNSGNTGNISAAYNCAGGIAGTNYSATIKNCYNDGEVYGVNGGVGGIVGLQSGNAPSTSYCYNKNSITAAGNIGGIVGNLSSGSVNCCYNIGQIICNTTWTLNMGGICGYNTSGTSVNNCYTLDTLNQEVVGAKADNTVDSLSKKETETNMKSEEFITILNSTENNFKKGDGYPILNWQ